jgi:hypothetical protein
MTYMMIVVNIRLKITQEGNIVQANNADVDNELNTLQNRAGMAQCYTTDTFGEVTAAK